MNFSRRAFLRRLASTTTIIAGGLSIMQIVRPERINVGMPTADGAPLFSGVHPFHLDRPMDLSEASIERILADFKMDGERRIRLRPTKLILTDPRDLPAAMKILSTL